MNKLDLAYIAGLMDGEGCFYIERFATKRTRIGFQYRVMATITMCDKQTIEYVASVTGKNIRVKKPLKSGRIAYVIDWRNGIADAFIRTILPFLKGKREQAEWCLRFADVAPGRGHTYDDAGKDKCEFIREKLKSLKRHSDLRC